MLTTAGSLTVVCEWSLVTTMIFWCQSLAWKPDWWWTDDHTLWLWVDDYGVAVIKQSRTVRGVTQVVDRDDGWMAVTPMKQSRTVLWISWYVEVVGATACVLHGGSAVGRWTCDLQVAGSVPGRWLSRNIGQLSLASLRGSLNRVPASAGGKGGILASVGWQLTLCDPIWHVSFQ